MQTFLNYLVGTILIAISIHQMIKAIRTYRKNKYDRYINEQAEIDEVMTMYENGQESG